MDQREEITFEINGKIYECFRWMEGKNYILDVLNLPSNKGMRSITIKIRNVDYFFFSNETSKIEDVVRDLETIYEKDIIHFHLAKRRFTFKSLTPDFYTSPFLNSEGMKPVKGK
jgi:hypothetical protein